MTGIILKVLILGGTTFLGPHLVHELQQHGHQITLFNRGNQNIHFSNIEQLQGDRDGNLEALKGKTWGHNRYLRTPSESCGKFI